MLRILGIFIGIFGFVFYVALVSFEATLPLVQFVKGDKVITRPIRVMLPPGTTFIKGTGTDGAKFVDIESPAAKFADMPRLMTMSKYGALFICGLGVVGFLFENKRARAAVVFKGLQADPEEILKEQNC
ncbi:MAG TPA: hypothetical protein VK171_01160 [Fimbriimonas sp.]|nr:hypothetical protein [Fimbriimonas sp.]